MLIKKSLDDGLSPSDKEQQMNENHFYVQARATDRFTIEDPVSQMSIQGDDK